MRPLQRVTHITSSWADVGGTFASSHHQRAHGVKHARIVTPSVVIPRLQEVDAIVADEVDDPVLGRESATPHVRPEVFQKFRLADPSERVAHDRLDDRERAAGRARISLDPPRQVVAELRLEDRDPPTAT